MLTKIRVTEILNALRDRNVVVLGDVMLGSMFAASRSTWAARQTSWPTYSRSVLAEP
jgi:hypothetical protein